MAPKPDTRFPINKPKHTATPCCICGKPLIDNEAFRTPEGYRHKKCGPGSKEWAKKHPETSDRPIVRMLAGKTPEGEKKPTPKRKATDPTQQAVKEFCGREKYMRYMDTVNSTKIEWEIYSQELGIKQTSAEPPLDPDTLYRQHLIGV